MSDGAQDSRIGNPLVAGSSGAATGGPTAGGQPLPPRQPPSQEGEGPGGEPKLGGATGAPTVGGGPPPPHQPTPTGVVDLEGAKQSDEPNPKGRVLTVDKESQPLSPPEAPQHPPQIVNLEEKQMEPQRDEALSQMTEEQLQTLEEVAEVKTEEGVSILQALADAANASWLGRVAAHMEDAAPAILAIAIAALQPEASAVVVAELGEEVAEAAEAAINWAALELEDIPLAPQNQGSTTAQVIERLRKAANKARVLPSDRLPEHRLPEQTRQLDRQATSWAKQRSKDEWASWRDQLKAWHAKKAAAAAAKAASDPDVMEGNPDLDIKAEPPVEPKKAVKLPSLEEGRWVKTGIHSITTSDVTTELFVDDNTTQVGPPDLFTVVGGTIRDNVPNFAFAAGQGYQIGSWIAEADAGGGTTQPQFINGTVFPFNNAPIPIGDPVARHDLHIHTGAGREKAQFTQAHISGLYQGGRPSERFVSSALNPELQLHPNAPGPLRALAGAVEYGWEVYDNSLMYAKLLYYAFLHGLFAAGNVAPQPNAFPDVAQIRLHWINISAAALAADAIPNAIVRKDIVLMEPGDVFQQDADLQLIYWLASPGMRFDGAVGAATPHACYVEWPAVPITVLARRDNPNQPDAAVLTATAIMQFASRLASNRREWQWFTKGAYIAMEVLGTRLVNGNAQWWPIRSNYSSHNPYLPAVVDYNVFFRLLRVYPPDSETAKTEASMFMAMSPVERVRVAALYSATLSAASTTLLYDINIRTAMLQNWATAAAEPPGLFNMIMVSGLNNPDVTNKENTKYEAVGCSQPRRAFKSWLGCGVQDEIWYNDTWCGVLGNNAGAAVAYGGLIAESTPCFNNPLIIDNWMLVRPIEWGVLGMHPKVALAPELRIVGNAAAQGWYASRGSPVYAARACSNEPMKMTIYGVQAINAITEILRRGAVDAPQLSHQNALWVDAGAGLPKDQVQWDAPVAYAAGVNPFVGPLHIFRPCSIMTFDWATNDVWAPCIIGAALGAADKIALSAYTGQTAETVGFALRRIGFRTEVLRVPPVLNLAAFAAFNAPPVRLLEGVGMENVNPPERRGTGGNPT